MEKKVPMRMCVVCREMKPKNELVRIVKTANGIVADKTGKVSGRGAYICHSQECLKKLRKAKILNKVFQTEVDESVYLAVEEALLANKE